jgi:hypothetical protein
LMDEADPIIFAPVARRCCYCKQVKDISEFPPNRYKKCGVQAYCRECNRPRAVAQMQRFRRENPELAMLRDRKRKYGITEEQFHSMLEAQDNACAICRRAITTFNLHVDHCHGTGRVRGLLCKTCNHGLGQFYDSPENLRRAAAYIER